MTTEQKPKPWQDRHPPCPTCGTPERIYRNPAAVRDVIEAARVALNAFVDHAGQDEVAMEWHEFGKLEDALAALDQEPAE
jgi:hypothetical protein